MKNATALLPPPSPRLNITRRLTLALLLAAAASPALHADNGTWASGTDGGNWWTDTNWTDNIVANGTNAAATFSSTATSGNITVTLDDDVTLGTLTLNANTANTGYTFSGTKTLTLSTGTGTAPSITANNGDSRYYYIDVTLAGTEGLIKNGSGKLYLRGNNTYTGVTTLNNMQLYVTNSNSLGATGAGNETIVHDSGNNYPQLHIANSLTTAEDITLRLHSSGGAAGSTIASNLLYNDSGANTQLDGTLTLARTTSGGADRIYAYGIQVGANSTLTLGNITGTLHSGAYTGAQASGNYADPNRLQFRLTAANATAIVSGVISDGDIGTGGLSVYTASNSTAGSQLTLAGKNTYTGNTVITIGNFTLASTGALAFDVEKGNQLQLTTTGDVTLDGEFNVDFGALLPTDDTTVTLVSVTGSAVAPNYGETFALNIQSSTSETIVLTFANNYQATNLSGNWEYSLATGSLSFVAGAAIPEPAIMAALLGLATLVVAACLRQHARQPPVIHASPAPPK